MANNHAPIIGAWYINQNSQYLKVWGVVYKNGNPDRIVLHYLNGTRLIIEREDWYPLGLLRYPEKNKQRSGATQG